VGNAQVAFVRAGQARVALDVRAVRDAIHKAAAGQGVALRVASPKRLVVVEAALQPLASAGAQHAAADAIAASCSAVARDCAARVRSIAEALQVPRGTVTYRAVVPPRWLDEASPAQVKVTVLVDGVTVGAQRVPVEWTANRVAWQLTKTVERGQAVRMTDVRSVVVAAEQVAPAAAAYDARTQLTHALTDLEAGTLIPAVGAHALAAFRRGESVVVAANVGPVRVHREATTLQNGRAGFAALVEFGPGQRTTAKLPPTSADTEEGERR
jgi:flagella basal body P-ring formation protein FlgA